MDDAVRAQVESVSAYARLMSETAASSRLYERDGVIASMCVAAPRQAMANVVTYTEPDRVVRRLRDLEEAYRETGIGAWQLWDWAGTSAAAVRGAGYERVGHMPGMTVKLRHLSDAGLEGFECTANGEMATVGRVNEEVYSEGGGLAAALCQMPGGLAARVWEARWERGTGAVLCMVELPGEDITGFFLATSPWASGNGLGRRLYLSALLDARTRGYTTASLQASGVGAPIYRRLGFEPVGDCLFEVYERSVA